MACDGRKAPVNTRCSQTGRTSNFCAADRVAPGSFAHPVKSYGFAYETRANYQNADFLIDLELALEQQLRDVYYLGPLRAFPARTYRWNGAQPSDVGRVGELVFDAILASRQLGKTISRGKGKRRRSLEEHVAHWLQRLGLIHSFAVRQLAEHQPVYEVRVQQSPKSAPVLITDVGFGVSQILPCLVLLFYVPPGSTVILEQPEIHLHPAVQAGLGDVLIEAWQQQGVQILLESHSEHLLRRIQRRVAEERVRKDDIAFFFCEAGDGGSRLDLLPLDPRREHHPLARGLLRGRLRRDRRDERSRAAAAREERPVKRQVREEVVVDTNVPVVANDGSDRAGHRCALACVNALQNIRRECRLLLDSGGRILREYRAHWNRKGPPGPGDAFVQWAHDCQGDERWCRLVDIAEHPERGFTEFPDDAGLARFDPGDRMFVAVARASGGEPPILNATDTDWWNYRAAFARCGVRIRFLCPELMEKG